MLPRFYTNTTKNIYAMCACACKHACMCICVYACVRLCGYVLVLIEGKSQKFDLFMFFINGKVPMKTSMNRSI